MISLQRHNAPPHPLNTRLRNPAWVGPLDKVRGKALTPTELRHKAHLMRLNGHPEMAALYEDEAEAREAVGRILGSRTVCPLCCGLGRIGGDIPCWRCKGHAQ